MLKGKPLDELKKIIAEVAECKVSEIDIDANIYSQLGIDSIKAVEITVMIEKKFKISIRNEQVASMITGRQIATLISGQLSKAKKKK